MQKIISLENAIKLDNPIYIDMRSPAEFRDGRIPGAVNIPLFNDDERCQVGTTYKVDGPDEAKQLGLSLVSSKLPEIVSQIRSLYRKGGTVIVYCWRGGMRSKAVVSVLDLVGIPAFQLVGGFKNYRRYVLDSLAEFSPLPPIVVLCGSTGVGKTTLLNILERRGVPVIDLEKLANHRGSAFGQIGMGRPETAQNFDAVLLNQLRSMQCEPYIVVECESKRVGNVYLPAVLYQAMQNGKKMLAYAGVETRITRLMDEYIDLYNKNREEIMTSLASLTRRLGAPKTQKLLDAFAANQVREVVRTLLIDYYDPLYGYEIAALDKFDYIVDAEDLDQAAEKIIEYLNTLGGNRVCKQ